MLDNDVLRKIYTPYKNLAEICHTARYAANVPKTANFIDCDDYLNAIKKELQKQYKRFKISPYQ